MKIYMVIQGNKFDFQCFLEKPNSEDALEKNINNFICKYITIYYSINVLNYEINY